MGRPYSSNRASNGTKKVNKGKQKSICHCVIACHYHESKERGRNYNTAEKKSGVIDRPLVTLF